MLSIVYLSNTGKGTEVWRVPSTNITSVAGVPSANAGFTSPAPAGPLALIICMSYVTPLSSPVIIPTSVVLPSAPVIAVCSTLLGNNSAPVESSTDAVIVVPGSGIWNGVGGVVVASCPSLYDRALVKPP